jgi:hypothetical protein
MFFSGGALIPPILHIQVFNAVLIRLVDQIRNNITEDTMETASHFIYKDCLQT